MIIGNAIYLGGTPLPALNNPAVAGDIRYGKQAVDGDGELLTGNIANYAGQTESSTPAPVYPLLTNPAAVTDVTSGKEYIDGQGVKQTGEYYNALELITQGLNPQWNNVSSGFTSNKITLNFPKMTSVRFYNCDFLANTEITVDATSITGSGFSNGFRINRNIKKITLLNLGKPTSFYQCFQNNYQLVEVNADIDMTNVVGAQIKQMFENCEALQTVRFVPNTIQGSYSDTFKNCMSLSDASLVYIANGLQDGITGQTLTLHSTPKARTLEIMGTVSQVTENAGEENEVTYNFFTADSEGTTSLNSFITNTKGWTLA